ncbi:MAG: hypothetical protein ACD_4C00312G0002 [uncultured bacterium (gcode 4)]|uniref:PKD domain-containing protein n=1 Tax=uncultured bacterium (gcode 4) TaxID=1234023 RepID=K2GSQ8_9BACT|nr:MAG: hypothetical protein ACD_4C00312G0002 [uncultured bacterium (gcode 4)]
MENKELKPSNNNWENSLLSQILSSTNPEEPEEVQEIPKQDIPKNADKENKASEKDQKKKNNLKTQDFIRIFWALFLVSSIFFWAFLAYIVFNPGQAQFFIQFWIRPQDIKTLLERMVNISFSIITLIVSIVWIIFLFRAILTKKEYKKKKTVSTILSIFTWIALFTIITLWAYLFEIIWATNYINPNWGIIISDNDKILSEKFKDNYELYRFDNLIWPLTLRFDFKSDVDFVRKRIDITSYEIDFNWDWKIDKNWTSPDEENSIIYTYNGKQIFKPKWEYIWIDILTWRERRVSMKFPDINIIWTVKLTEQPQRLWWKKIIFDASDLRNIWKVNWYLEWNNTAIADYEWYKFFPKNIFSEESIVCMNIFNNLKKTNTCDKIFIVNIWEWWNKNSWWIIKYDVDPLNPLTLKFSIEELKDREKISSFKWVINENNIISEDENPEYTFKWYWKHKITVILEDYLWNSSDISAEIILNKPLTLVRPDDKTDPLNVNNSLLRIENENWESVIWKTYQKELSAYYIKTQIPQKLKFNANFVKVTDLTFELTNVEWDFNDDKKFEKTWKSVDHEFLEDTKYVIKVEYTFESKIKKATQKISESIIVEWLKKDFNVELDFKKESDYAPALVKFDWSASQVKNWRIIKYTYDFWENKAPIVWDAKIDYMFNFPWEYTVTFTVTKDDWTEESIEKKIILKWAAKELAINSSVWIWYEWKPIDFDAIGSIWEIDRYNWDFWDWQSSRDPNPTHIFDKSWTFKVKLTITFSDGSVKTWTKEIIIKEDSEN